MLFLEPIEEVRPVVRNYLQECIDRAKAARARMAAAATRRVEIDLPHPARIQIAKYQWYAIASKLNAMEKKRVEPPIVRAPSVRQIVMEVCKASGISVADLLSQRRTANVIVPRQFAMWRARTETLKSLPEVGRQFGGKDHSTVINACRKTEQRLAAGQIPQALLATIPKGVDV